MCLSEQTINFVNKFVLPKIGDNELNNENISKVIKYIEKEFEEPLSQGIASGEYVDLDYFTFLNNIISDLVINK